MDKEIWIVEYNYESNDYLNNHSWHIDTLDNLIKNNNYIIFNEKSNEFWIVVAQAESYKVACEKRDIFMRLMESEKQKTDILHHISRIQEEISEQ